LLWPLLDAVEPADDDAAPRERVVSLVSRAVDDGGVVIGRAGGRDVVEVSLVENQWRVWQELEAAGAPVPVETLAERLGVARGGANSVIQRMRSKLEKAGLGQAIGNVWGEGYELQREIPWQGGA
ncbi:MAG TPA: helix-turn-helix domain-containing protein, partial [Myxococcota bacterium]|nr:helix-turn-helix domain-containing protein [Myxococcota bacterium]